LIVIGGLSILNFLGRRKGGTIDCEKDCASAA
jgi:hypothetical protein